MGRYSAIPWIERQTLRFRIKQRQNTHTLMPVGTSTKRLIIKTCREIMESKKASDREKVKAAAIALQTLREKYLAPVGRRRMKRDEAIPEQPQPTPSEQVSAILDHAAA